MRTYAPHTVEANGSTAASGSHSGHALSPAERAWIKVPAWCARTQSTAPARTVHVVCCPRRECTKQRMPYSWPPETLVEGVPPIDISHAAISQRSPYCPRLLSTRY